MNYYMIMLITISLKFATFFIQDIDIDKNENNAHYFSTIEPDL